MRSFSATTTSKTADIPSYSVLSLPPETLHSRLPRWRTIPPAPSIQMDGDHDSAFQNAIILKPVSISGMEYHSLISQEARESLSYLDVSCMTSSADETFQTPTAVNHSSAYSTPNGNEFFRERNCSSFVELSSRKSR